MLNIRARDVQEACSGLGEHEGPSQDECSTGTASQQQDPGLSTEQMPRTCISILLHAPISCAA